MIGEFKFEAGESKECSSERPLNIAFRVLSFPEIREPGLNQPLD
jgi:hypothetical protein